MRLYNSITENSHVARGIYGTDENHRLVDIQERTRIENHGGRAEYTEGRRKNLGISSSWNHRFHEYVRDLQRAF